MASAFNRRVRHQREGLSMNALGVHLASRRILGAARHGGRIFTTASCACACGKPALRIWNNVGYCKAHAPERIK